LFALWLAGCAAPGPQDSFSGTYRFVDPGEKGYVVVSPMGPDQWAVQMSTRGGPPAAHPLSGSPMVVASPALLASTFATPMAQTTCLASSGRHPAALICRVPVDVPYRVVNAMDPKRSSRSATGYIYLVGTPAGAIAVDVIRTP